jgi:thymidylate synthase (FAD)
MKRPSVAALERAIAAETQIWVLDHGFIQILDYMGDDEAIVNAARTSYGAGTKQLRENKALLDYLVRHEHTSPFEMCEIKLLIHMPIFVARQWVRHRTANLNEVSLRYSEATSDWYLPTHEHMQGQDPKNRQGRGEGLPDHVKDRVRDRLINEHNYAWHTYQDNLEEGLARELARTSLPLSTYTTWTWKIDLRNLIHFLRLRCDHHAQYEIRAYADEIKKIAQAWVPLAMEAFETHTFNAVSMPLQILHRIMQGAHPGAADAKRWQEIEAELERWRGNQQHRENQPQTV